MIRSPDTLTLSSRVADGPDRFRFHTADGVRSSDSFSTPELLLVEACWDADLGDLLCVESNYGTVGTVLSWRADGVHMTESNARCAALCERNIRENDADATVSLVADPAATGRRFRTATYAPTPSTPIQVGKRHVTRALASLRPGGRLYLAAAPHTGLNRYEACLDAVGASVSERRRDGDYRLLVATRPESVERVGPRSTTTIQPTVDDVDLSLVTTPGLFSVNQLDDGTRLLLESSCVADDDRVLDLCCGYGPVGIYAAKTADCTVWLSDADRVATEFATRSLRASDVDGTVVTADCVEGVRTRRFDRVLCNPPTHAGDGVLADLFTGAAAVLAPDGRLSVVHHRALDFGAHLSRYSHVERVASGSEHVVLTATP